MDKIVKEIIEWGKVILSAVVIAFIVTQFIRPTLVRGESMYPTLEENDYLIINRMAYKVSEPKRGDIIVFTTDLTLDDGSHKDLVKRIIATEGDHVKVENSNVYINDELLEESYINENYTDGNIDIVVPEGKVFAMGDNRERSLDSRHDEVGLVDEDQIMGKLLIRLFPFDRIGTVD